MKLKWFNKKKMRHALGWFIITSPGLWMMADVIREDWKLALFVVGIVVLCLGVMMLGLWLIEVNEK